MPKKNLSLLISKQINKFNKTIQVDSDKSISIRSFLIGAISHGISKVKNVLESEDVLAAIKCLKKLGVKIIKVKGGQYEIYGKGLGSLYCKKRTTIDCENSGTLARLLTGILSTTPNINVTIKGDHSLNKRNMEKLIGLMSEFGAEFYPKKKIRFPLNLVSSAIPIGIKYKSGVSAQLKSAVILAGLNSYGNTSITELKESRNHTENILAQNKNILKIKKNNIKVTGKSYLKPLNISVPGDPSSAAFFTAITLFTKNSFLKIKNVGLNERRTGYYKLLKNHGANIQFRNLKKNNNEIIGDIHIKSSRIKPIKSGEKYYASTTDEYVILLACAALIPGVSIFKGISDLSNKESSRAIEMKKILKQIGIKSRLNKNEIKVYGSRNIIKSNKLIKVSNLGDHRICMAAACLSLITGIESNIKSFNNQVNSSSPNFLKTVKLLGGNYETKKN